MTAAEERQRPLGRGLVRLAEHAEARERFQGALALAQLERVVAAARQEMELVAEDVADRPQLAAVAVALAQQAPERESASIAESLEIHRHHAETRQIVGEGR